MPDQQQQSDTVRDALNASPTGQHLLLGELVFPFVSTESTTDGAVTVQVDGAHMHIKVYSAELGYYTTFTGQLTAAAAESDIKDALVAAGIIEDSGPTPLDLDEGDITAKDITLSGNLAAASGDLSAATLTISGNSALSGNLVVTLDLTARNIWMTGTLLGFYNTTPAAKPTVTGAKGGNAALGSLLTALSGLGLVTDSTSA